ncbi:MAG TPA: DUF1800 domain-containing protein [Longimicrobiales bacterium]|nr:DUF1800 domain-containing protein [Longimicrobiales bacterium]
MGRLAGGQDSAAVAHLLSRATFGVRPGDVAAVQQIGVEKWLDKQLHPPVQTDSASHSYNLGVLVLDRLSRAVTAEEQVEDLMAYFWFNHFNVFYRKGPVRYLVSDYERNAIRPYVFGKFSDMLRATAQHPAMLLYLDNARSNVVKGINENYARELMELHTLGVDGGYTQADVIAVARAFTGWTIDRRDSLDVRFRFAPRLHDRDEKIVLGHKLRAGRGIQDGEDVLDMLSKDPRTARFIAKKLVQRFVSDDAPADFVDDIAKVFLKTDGDLRSVTKALFTSPKFYDAKYRNNKVKTPFELVASALRVNGQRPNRAMMEALRTLGELPYMAEAPTGYPAVSAEWINSGAMLTRAKFGPPAFQMK